MHGGFEYGDRNADGSGASQIHLLQIQMDLEQAGILEFATVWINAQDLHRFLEQRHHCSSAPPGCEFSAFHALSVDNVIAAIHQLLDKQFAADPFQRVFLRTGRTCLHRFSLRCLTVGVFPMQFKAAFITPLLKKSDLDPSQGKSYRPISNLTVLSKTLERLVACQLVDYLREQKLFPELQSAYRA